MVKEEADTLLAEFLLRTHPLRASVPLFIGIDPGAEGAIAFVASMCYAVIDIPTIQVKRSGGKKTEFNKPAIIQLFNILRASHQFRDRTHVILEVPPPSMGPGKGSAYAQFRLGCAYAMWPLFLLSKGYHLTEISPGVWKKAMGLSGADKETSRFKALGMFPKADLQKKKHHNRAEALLLAEYLRRQHQGESR